MKLEGCDKRKKYITVVAAFVCLFVFFFVNENETETKRKQNEKAP